VGWQDGACLARGAIEGDPAHGIHNLRIGKAGRNSFQIGLLRGPGDGVHMRGDLVQCTGAEKKAAMRGWTMQPEIFFASRILPAFEISW